MQTLKSASTTGIIVALFAALLPFVNSSNLFTGSINAKYFFVVGFVTVVALHYFYKFFKGKTHVSMHGRWLLGLTFLLLGAHYLSTFAGVYPLGSLFSDILRSTGVIFLTYIFFLAFWLSEMLTKHDWKLVRRAIAYAGGVMALLLFFGGQGIDVSGTFLTVNLDTAGLSLGNTTFAGAFLLITLAITLIELVHAESKKEKYIFGVLALLHLFSPLIFSFDIWTGGVSLTSPVSFLGEARASSATAWMLVMFLLGLWSIHRLFSGRKHKAAALVWSSFWLLGIFSGIILLFTPNSVVQEQYIGASTAARIIVWEDAIEAIKERPLLGWGPENFRLAHYGYLDNRLYLDETIGETWFDRAHNIIIDTLVSFGVVGTLVFLALALYLVFVFWRAYRGNVIGYAEASIFSTLVFAHFLQLQTSFDTVVTYTLIAIIVGYALWLECQMLAGDTGSSEQGSAMGKAAGVLLMVAVLVGGWRFVFVEHSKQRALVDIFRTTDSTTQTQLIERAISDSFGFEQLRFSSLSLVEGLLESIANADPSRRDTIIAVGQQQLALYEGFYKEHLERVPDDYRARMDYAYILLTQTVLGNDKTDEAHAIIADAYELSPGNPLTYVMDALAYLYGGEPAKAREKTDEALAINPDIPFSNEVDAYMKEQIPKVPHITVIRLQNL